MRLNGYRCDGCGKDHLLESTRVPQYFGEGIPSTWFVIGRGDRDQQILTFCSTSCAGTWFQRDVTPPSPVQVED